MIRTKLFVACALALMVSLAGTAATAQEPTNQITYFTFSAPFELPGGKTLPAGKYVFRIVDSPSSRHVVQVMSEDQQTLHATLLAIPAQRMEASDEPEIRFMEAEANAAPAIRTWWYPGRTIGHEFIYPKDHARRLASRQSEGVLTTAADTPGDDAMRTADLARLGANGQETAVAENNAAANMQTPNTQSNPASTTNTTGQTASSGTMTGTTQSQTTAPATTSAQTTASSPTTAQTTAAETSTSAQTAAQSSSTQTRSTATTQPTQAAENTARAELPRTASPLPFIALLGLGSLLGAGVLRFRR